MQKKKEKFLDKIVKKNYNNELEIVLEQKSFDENTKNILLTVLYKLETAYKDYRTVKQNVMPKDEFLQKIIDTIQNNVDEIKIVKMNSEESKKMENRSFIVEKNKKRITSYPIERKMLYALAEISKKDKIVKNKYVVLDTTMSDLLNIGNNINTVEPMRDFNGFSWDTVAKEIESLEYNLLYQDLRILVGAKFLNDWVYNKEFIIDYFELFSEKLQEIYGENIADAVINMIGQLSVLLEIKYNKFKLEKYETTKKEVEKSLMQLDDKVKFIKALTKEKKDLSRTIKNLDTIISDKDLLQAEYMMRNEDLPLDKKIFSMRVLANMLKDERKTLIKRLEKINDMLNPQKFVRYKNKLEEQYKYLKLIETSEDSEKECEKLLLEFQKLFIECVKIKIARATTKDELIKLLYEFRYYLNLPYSKTRKIYQVKNLNAKIEETISFLVNKLITDKVCVRISNNDTFNYIVLKNIFYTRIINLASVDIKITKEEDAIYLQLFDEDIFDDKIEICNINEINLKDLQVKLNKNIKIFYA